MKDVMSYGFYGTASAVKITFASWTSPVATDIGKMVEDDGVVIGALAFYGEIGGVKTWKIGISGLTVASGSVMTIVGGTGHGTTNAVSSATGGGAIMMGHGFTAVGDAPRISLVDSALGFDTLELTKADGSTRAHLKAGNLDALALNSYVPGAAPEAGGTDGLIIDCYPPTHSDGLGIQSGGVWIKYDNQFRFYHDSGATVTQTLHIDSVGTVTFANAMLKPPANNQGNIGGDGTGTDYYWGSVWANYLKYHTSHAAFDALDDLGLVKNYKLKTETRMVSGEEIDVDVIDSDSLPFLKDENGFHDPARVNGFLLGCAKFSALKHDGHDKRMDALEAQIKDLQMQLNTLKNKDAVS
jgi:hypothetical protein